MKRRTLKTGYLTCKDVLTDIDSFHAQFRKEFGKAPKSQLIYGSVGVKKDEKHELGVIFESGQEKEVEFFAKLVNK